MGPDAVVRTPEKHCGEKIGVPAQAGRRFDHGAYTFILSEVRRRGAVGRKKSRKPAAQSGSAAMTSMTECCFMNTVEIHIISAVNRLSARMAVEEKRFVSHSANIEASEPMTCIDGQTLVLVSK